VASGDNPYTRHRIAELRGEKRYLMNWRSNEITKKYIRWIDRCVLIGIHNISVALVVVDVLPMNSLATGYFSWITKLHTPITTS